MAEDTTRSKFGQATISGWTWMLPIALGSDHHTVDSQNTHSQTTKERVGRDFQKEH